MEDRSVAFNANERMRDTPAREDGLAEPVHSEDARPIDVGALMDSGRWSGLQVVALAAAALGFAMEGLASQAMGLALPALAKAWHAPHSAFALATAAGLVGFAVGAAICGYIGDRIGRRNALLLSIAIFGFGTLACSFARDPSELSLIRLIAGAGLGGAIPSATALTAEFAPTRHRSLAIAVGLTFLPLGGFLSGLIASHLLPRFGWTSLFMAIGAVSLVGGLILAPVLPESPRYLASRPAGRVRLVRLLRRMGRAVADDTVFTAGPAPDRPAAVGRLFDPSHRRDTVFLWAAYFFLVMDLYLVFSWAPAVLNRSGFSLAQASTALSIFALGGMISGLISGWLTERLGSRISILALTLLGAAAALWLALCAANRVADFRLYAAALAVLGGCLSGVQTALYAVGAYAYPAALRSTGLGAAVAAGRVGAVLSAYVAVAVLGAGGPPTYFAALAVGLGLALGGAMLTACAIRPAATPPARLS